MTTPRTTAKTAQVQGRFRLPDPPERDPDDMTSAEHLSETGLRHYLKQFLGNPETRYVCGEKYVTARHYHPVSAVAVGSGEVLMARLREGRANTARGAPPSSQKAFWSLCFRARKISPVATSV